MGDGVRTAHGRSVPPVAKPHRWLLAGVAAVLLPMSLAGCGGAGGSQAAAITTRLPTTGAPTTAPAPTTADRASSTWTSTTRPPPDPGRLPQTKAFPTTTSAHFRQGVQDLWTAIATNQPVRALPFFFPVTAYVQAKAGPNNVADWRDRLWYLFTLDVAAAHRFVGPGAAQATLLGVSVPSSQAEWVLPGEEFNKEPYWRVWGTRLRFRSGSRVGSFGVFQLISWRGQWYVVHLGPATRAAYVGIVWQPSG